MKSGILALLVAVGLIAAGRDHGAPPVRPTVPLLASARPSAPSGGTLQPLYAAVDYRAVAGSVSNTNGMLEPNETVQVSPFWTNTAGVSQTFTGFASGISGPPGPAYSIVDANADYGTLAAGATTDCNGATGDCYLISVAGARPVAHWDLTFTETLSVGGTSTVWTVHIGDSFADVPTTDQFYSYIEMLFHMGVTSGCGGGNYCPTNPVTRAQMAVFLLKAKLGSGYVPPPATGTVFNDVHIGDFAADWIEDLHARGITGGCGNGDYCPNNSVTRAQMSVFLLRAEHGSSYTPPPCTPTFGDVACPSPFAAWIEQLFNEHITGGCGGGNYCPDSPNTRGQMAVFLVKTFGPPAPPIPTPTPVPPTFTSTPVTPTNTPTITPTVPTPTRTPTVLSPTPTLTNTPITPTATFTITPSITQTRTNTFTATKTNTAMPTNTFTPTFTKTFTPTVTPTFLPTISPFHIVNVGPDDSMSFVDSTGGSSLTTIPVGTTVQWVWQSGPHSSTSGQCVGTNCTPDSIWTSGQQDQGATYNYTFNTVGTFSYYCTVHTFNMTGVVNVLPLTPTPSTARR